MDQINIHFSTEELKFCISALQLEIEDVEQDMRDTDTDSAVYIQKLNQIQDEFLVENNTFELIDLFQVYILVQRERDYLSTLLDDFEILGEERQDAQRYLRTANSVLRELKKGFKSNGIDV